MLPDNDLALMRAELDKLMPSVCHILTATRTYDGAGGWVDGWGTVTANVSCRLDMTKGGELVAGAAVKPYAYYTLTVPYDTTITEINRVEHGGYTYAVTTVDADKSWGISKRATLEMVT